MSKVIRLDDRTEEILKLWEKYIGKYYDLEDPINAETFKKDTNKIYLALNNAIYYAEKENNI